MRYKGEAGKIWELCKQVIRKRDGDKCVICGTSGLEGVNAQTGHFIPSGACGAYLRFNIRNLHLSCYRCNINLGGNGAIFAKSLENKYGKEFVDRIHADRSKIIKADKLFYAKQREELERLLNRTAKELFDDTKDYQT